MIRQFLHSLQLAVFKIHRSDFGGLIQPAGENKPAIHQFHPLGKQIRVRRMSGKHLRGLRLQHQAADGS